MAFLENYSREMHFPEGKHFPSAGIGRYAKRPLTDGVVSAMACQQEEYTSSCTLFGALGPARLVHLRLQRWGRNFMRLKTCLAVFVAAIFVVGCNLALAQEEGRDHDRGRDREESREGHDKDHFYGDHDREAMHGWYAEHHDHLPPGLRDRDPCPPNWKDGLWYTGYFRWSCGGKCIRVPQTSNGSCLRHRLTVRTCSLADTSS